MVDVDGYSDPIYECDFCNKEVSVVRRVVIDSGYNRMLGMALYACFECSVIKDKERILADE